MEGTMKEGERKASHHVPETQPQTPGRKGGREGGKEGLINQ
jgi:hypothetical protein